MLGRSSKNKPDVDLLLKQIEEQNDQINRLQSKFRDVTAAYKNVLNEKKALEIIVKSIDPKKDAQKSKASSNSGNTLAPGSRSVSNSDLSEVDYQPDEDKVQALTANIQAVLENKTKMEQIYHAERKKLLVDLEELKQKFENFKLESDKSKETYENRVKELKISLKQSQLEREKLTQELNSMIKIKSSEQENKILSAQEETQGLLFNLRNENIDLKQKIKKFN